MDFPSSTNAYLGLKLVCTLPARAFFAVQDFGFQLPEHFMPVSLLLLEVA
jgi:hypothetical protein